MRQNRVKQVLRDGGVTIGTFVMEFATTGLARIAAEAGAEFAVLDMEHTGWTMETIRMLLATARPTDLVPVVRVPASDYHFIARALDMGAMGIMVPMVESAEQARAIVQAGKYPPVGRRGSAFSVSHDDFKAGDMGERIEEANREVLLIAQIETVKGLEKVEEIAKVDGIDILFLGQADLTSSMGIPGQYSHPKFIEAVDRIAAVAKANNKHLGYLALRVEDAPAMLARGFRFIANGGDIWVYQGALRNGIKTIRAAAEQI